MPSSRIVPVETADASVNSATARVAGNPIAAISAGERAAISAAVGNRVCNGSAAATASGASTASVSALPGASSGRQRKHAR